MKQVVIVGSGGLAREVLQVALDINRDYRSLDILGFVDPGHDISCGAIQGVPVLGNLNWLKESPDSIAAVLAIPDSQERRQVCMSLTEAGHTNYATLVHPRAWLGQNVAVAMGTVVCAGSSLSTDISIGPHSIINLNCTIGYDVTLHHFVTVEAGVQILGSSRLDSCCEVGAGSTIGEGVTIGECATITRGSAVHRSVPAHQPVSGVPAGEINLVEDLDRTSEVTA